ncbi:MAG: DUF2157 domain-containing protein [Pseudomonadota bacterium]
MSARKIDAWHEAGLIDSQTRTNLLAYEAEHARPLALWSVFGIGALAIGLGVVSVVAANWEEVPGQVRLSIHFALLAGLLGVVIWREDRLTQASPWAVEAMVCIAAALGLTFFGHLGQVYQTSSPLWVPLALWLALFGPMLLLTGRSWLSATLVMGGALYCVWEYNWSAEFSYFAREEADRPNVWIAFVLSAPVLFAPLGAYLRARSTRPVFWRRLEQLALTYAVFGACMAATLASSDAFTRDQVGGFSAASIATHATVVAVAGVLVALARPSLSGRMAGAIIIGAGAVILIARSVSGVDIAAALLFIALWIGIAAAAIKVGWRGVFQVAVAVIAVRLIILSFELASDLLLSGFGLILSGLLILGIALAAYRVSRAFAPETSSGEGESGTGNGEKAP